MILVFFKKATKLVLAVSADSGRVVSTFPIEQRAMMATSSSVPKLVTS
jgi:hypothetical protein